MSNENRIDEAAPCLYIAIHELHCIFSMLKDIPLGLYMDEDEAIKFGYNSQDALLRLSTVMGILRDLSGKESFVIKHNDFGLIYHWALEEFEE